MEQTQIEQTNKYIPKLFMSVRCSKELKAISDLLKFRSLPSEDE